MRRIGLAVMLVVLSGSALALSKGKAVYIGGTISVIKDNTEGLINLSDETKLAFTPKGGIELALPWTKVSEVEYGQKAGKAKSSRRSCCHRSPSSRRTGSTT